MKYLTSRSDKYDTPFRVIYIIQETGKKNGQT